MPKKFKTIPVQEDVRIGIDLALKRFRNNDEEKELEFPSSFTSVERAYIHRLIATYGLTSKSKGKGASRFLTVYKKDRSSLMKSEAKLTLTDKAKKAASLTITQYPVTNKERQELLPPKDRGVINPYLLNEARDMSRAMGKLNGGIPQIPPPASNYEEQISNWKHMSNDGGIMEHRKQLPIWLYRSDIIQSIVQNQVTIITGETGSGKTTQVPQFILEHAFDDKSPCRIICTEPRRLAAVAMAERVASERGEKVGQTVGFQIRLESRVSPRTLLTFCTNGVLLRTLMGSGPSTPSMNFLGSLAAISHVIIDEVHERDRFSDFLLTVLRDALSKFTSLKIIIMSATIDVTQFMNYFGNAHHINVPGKIYPVKELYLEEILLQTGYSTPIMEKERKNALKLLRNGENDDVPINQCFSSESFNRPLEDAISGIKSNKEEGLSKEHEAREWAMEECVTLQEKCTDDLDEDIIVDIDERSKNEMDRVLSDAFRNTSDTSFKELTKMLFNEEGAYVPIDYMHSKTGVNALMCAAGNGKIDIIEQLLMSGADPSLKATNGWTAQDFALQMGHDIAGEIIDDFRRSLFSVVVDTGRGAKGRSKIEHSDTYFNLTTKADDEMNMNVEYSATRNITTDLDRIPHKKLNQEEEAVLRGYHKIFDDDSERGVDKSLIVTLVNYIVNKENHQMAQDVQRGSILIFLPGYEDIVGINDLLKGDTRLSVLMLHSQMVSIDQKKIFRPPPNGITKVILSTNIAETSITIDDVGHVIDTGKVKEKSYDSLAGVSMLRVTWISQNSAIQRKGRAGRTQAGICYRLFSSVRYSNMSKSSTPEILRTPLMELCLATKLLAPLGTPIADFLARAPDPPSFSATRAAVHDLKQMEAIDSWEDVTELGNHLLDLPIEPRLGKMVLYAVVLKCLDPILTIVCCVSYKDPFMLSSNPSLVKATKVARKTFSGESMSDHMTLLRVFQGWQKARVDGTEKSFCYHNQVSSSTMDMVTGMRTQLLGQLRASGFVRAKGFGDIRDLNRNSENWAVVKAALVAGAYPNLARYDKEFKLLRTSKESKVRLHPSSVLLDSFVSDKSNKASSTSAISNQKVLGTMSADWYMFDEMTRAGRLAMIRGVTVVSPITVAIFAGPNRFVIPEKDMKADEKTSDGNNYLEDSSDSESEDNKDKGGANVSTLRLDDWTVFRTEKHLVHLLLQIRQKWSALFLRRLQCAGKPMTQVDDSIVQTLVHILSSEEAALGLIQPVGIGQRPKAIPPPESISSNSFVASPEKTNIRSGNSNYSQKFTTYKDKPATLFQSTATRASFAQPSPMVNEDRAIERGLSQPIDTKNEKMESVDSSTKYFVIKATNSHALEFSLANGLWQFGNQTERRLSKAIKGGYSVILIFSVQGSSHFQGFALFSGRVSSERYSELQSQGQGSGTGSQYFIDWIKKGNVPFQAAKHLVNMYNENKRVQTSRDGQELDPSAGNDLCKMWDRVPHYMTSNHNPEVGGAHGGGNTGKHAGENYYPGSYPKNSRRITGRFQHR